MIQKFRTVWILFSFDWERMTTYSLVVLSLVLAFFSASCDSNKIDAVVLTTAKDTRAFIKSIESGLKHLVDVDKIYVVTPHVEDLTKQLAHIMSPRIVLVDESVFPFTGENVTQVMFETVRERGLYPMTGNSQFEKTVWGRIGWFLQQLLKLYAGRVIGLGDFVLLDSDLVWFKDIKFFADSSTDSATSTTTPVTTPSTESASSVTLPAYTGPRYNYVTSSQYHGAYLAILERIAGVPFLANQPVHRSGVCHHMVVVKSVMDDLIDRSEKMHGLPFWQVLLNVR